MTATPLKLDTSILPEDAQSLFDKLNRRVIGQDRAVKQFVKAYCSIMSGLNKEGRPAGVFLFAGPTGCGKTELARAVAEILFGSRTAYTRINCAEFQHSHEVSKLLGSPPGYLGHRETPAALCQQKIDKFQTAKHKINLVLFDEIEKANEALFELLLGVLDEAMLTLGNNETVDFSKTIVILTSNLGAREIKGMVQDSGIGFKGTVAQRLDLDTKIYAKTKEAVEKKFSPEFVNRLDRLIVFRSLSEESLRKILDIELYEFEMRIWRAPWKLADKKIGDTGFVMPPQLSVHIVPTQRCKDFLIVEGTSAIYGARELNRAIERFIAYPMSLLIGSKQAAHGDVITIDHEKDSKELVFIKTKHVNQEKAIWPEFIGGK